MNVTSKKIISRLLWLLVPILIANILHFVTFDPHKRCVGNEHRHVDGYLGVALFSMFWFYGWLAFVVLEVIIFQVKKYLKTKG